MKNYDNKKREKVRLMPHLVLLVNGITEFFFSLKMFLFSKMSLLVLEIRENAIINPDLMHNFLIQSTFPTVLILQPSLIYFSLGSGITS